MIVHHCEDCGYDFDQTALDRHKTLGHCDPDVDPLARLTDLDSPIYRLGAGPANYAHDPPWNAGTALPRRRCLAWVAVYYGSAPAPKPKPKVIAEAPPVKQVALW